MAAVIQPNGQAAQREKELLGVQNQFSEGCTEKTDKILF